MLKLLSLVVAMLAFSASGLFSQQVNQSNQAKPAALTVGMPAPALKMEKWIKGAPVASFEKGKVYMVEFWATWCGPCIQSMPHLSALQKEYKDKGFTIIGTNIWEDKVYDDKTLPNVEKFVATQGERMAYTVAYDGKAKAMDASYMQAAALRGIPAAFLVDQKGTIAWIGHPAKVDYALSEVIKGTWDTKSGPETENKIYDQLMAVGNMLAGDPAGAQAAFDKFAAAYPAVAKHQDDLRLALLRANGQWDKFYAALAAQIDEAIKGKDAGSLNEIAWTIVDPEAKLEKCDVELAMRAALKADEFSGSKDPAILDTLARCYATKGDYAKALELQTKACAMAEGNMKSALDASLEEYKEKLGK